MFDKLIKMLSVFGDKSKDADEVKQQLKPSLAERNDRGLMIPYFRGEGKPGTLNVPSVLEMFSKVGVKGEGIQGDYQDVYDYTSKYRPNKMGNEIMALFSVLADAGIIDTSGTGGWGKDAPKNYWGEQHDYYSKHPEEYRPQFDVPYQMDRYTASGFPVFEPYKPK